MQGLDSMEIDCFLGLILGIECPVLRLPCIDMEHLWHMHGRIQYGIGYLWGWSLRVSTLVSVKNLVNLLTCRICT